MEKERTTERTVVARKVQGNRRYREAQSKLVVHITIMNRFRGAYVPWNGTEKSKPECNTCRGKAALFQ